MNVPKPFADLIAKYPNRHFRISEQDYDLAREELLNQLEVPLLDPALAQAIVDTWEVITNAVARDAEPGAKVVWIDVHRNGNIAPAYVYR